MKRSREKSGGGVAVEVCVWRTRVFGTSSVGRQAVRVIKGQRQLAAE